MTALEMTSVGDDARSQDDLYRIAEESLPGAGLGGYSLPEEVRFVIRRGEGSRVISVEGRSYIDYVGGAGALILGHAHPALVAAAQARCADGLHFFGTLNDLAIELAGELVEAIPCADKVIFATTGSEATFYAMRIARAAKQRNKILKFEGAYHGNHDYASVSIMPTQLANYPYAPSDTGGVPSVVPDTVLVAPYNDLDVVEAIVREHMDDLAAIIVEPIQRIISPQPGFLAGLRKICDDNDIVLIFDEVVTGFRVAYGGAQEYFGVTPDLASYGKIVGGGGPLSCVGGRKDLIDLCDPKHKGQANYAYINGTLHGNPIAAAAALASLQELKRPGRYDELEAMSNKLLALCQEVLNRHGLPAIATGQRSLWQILFRTTPPKNQADLFDSDQAAAKALDLAQLRQGIYVLPGVRRFVSMVHSDEDFAETAEALDAACRDFKR
ncbi:MAG: aspartate aminotransferase family protein [Pseudomonadota bacterium]